VKKFSSEFINTAEQVNIWVFLTCVIVAVGCMFPEAVMGASEFNTSLSLIANVAMISLCFLWLTTQILWFGVRKYLERQSKLVQA
jgi:hypothetical protein